jgi:hypothetical protein
MENNWHWHYSRKIFFSLFNLKIEMYLNGYDNWLLYFDNELKKLGLITGILKPKGSSDILKIFTKKY